MFFPLEETLTKKADPAQGRFFLTLEEFQPITADEVNALKRDYDVTFEEIEYSSFTSRAWTTYGELIIHGNSRVKFNSRYVTEQPTVIVFRPRGISHISDPTFLFEESILECPYSRVVLYPSTNKDSKIAKYRATHPSNSTEGSKGSTIISIHNVTYQVPELSLLEKDYIRDLFTVMCDSIRDEQEKVAKSMALSRLKMPVCQLLGRFVTEMALEELDDRYYITFTYEERGRVNHTKSSVLSRNSKSEEAPSEIPLHLEILSDIPLEEGDALDETDESGVVVDDDSFVRYSLVLELYTPDDDSSIENRKP